jgi:DNA polymerase
MLCIIQIYDFLTTLPEEEGQIMDCAAKLAQLQQSLAGCTLCDLNEKRTNIVFGRGAAAGRIMLVGEGPGGDEDRLGYPFVGKAGQLLDKILAAAELPPEDVYICNIVKCRPPGNRLPLPPEVEACKPFLREQIRIVQPKIIVCLGALATQTLLDQSARITRDRGKWQQKGAFWIIATFHPAALLRDEMKKRPVWQDMQAVRDKYFELCGKPNKPDTEE